MDVRCTQRRRSDGSRAHVKSINHNNIVIIIFPKDTDDAHIIENIKKKNRHLSRHAYSYYIMFTLPDGVVSLCRSDIHKRSVFGASIDFTARQ